MASACFLANKPDEAQRYAQLALSATGEMSSHRTWHRLRQMYRLTARYDKMPEVAHLRAEITKALPNQPRPQIV
jgi:hypothetical protein